MNFAAMVYEVVDWIANYFEHIDEYHVLSQIEPGLPRKRSSGVHPRIGAMVTGFADAVTSFIGIFCPNFDVYGLNGKLVNLELLPKGAEIIAVHPSGDGVEAILVGGKDAIRKYAVH